MLEDDLKTTGIKKGSWKSMLQRTSLLHCIIVTCKEIGRYIVGICLHRDEKKTLYYSKTDSPEFRYLFSLLYLLRRICPEIIKISYQIKSLLFYK